MAEIKLSTYRIKQEHQKQTDMENDEVLFPTGYGKDKKENCKCTMQQWEEQDAPIPAEVLANARAHKKKTEAAQQSTPAPKDENDEVLFPTGFGPKK